MKNPFSCPLEVFTFGFLVGILLDCVCVFLEAKSRSQCKHLELDVHCPHSSMHSWALCHFIVEGTMPV